MKIHHKFLLKYIIFYIFIFSISCQNCLMKEHNFYLIPLIKENKIDNLTGLHKYDYYLILKTDPLNENNNDNYHMVFLISFPININIELSTEIIYKFESTRKFCIKDLIKSSAGKQSNIQGKISEYNSGFQILEAIWIKVEKILLYKEVLSYERQTKFFLLTEFYEKDKNKKKYLLMKKMSNSVSKQIFQIIRVNIDSELESNQCLNEEEYIKIGTEFTIQHINSGEDSMLREGLTYETFTSDKVYKIIYNIENLICLIYENKLYNDKCFSSNTNN